MAGDADSQHQEKEARKGTITSHGSDFRIASAVKKRALALQPGLSIANLGIRA
jgi:hypothetical protein